MREKEVAGPRYVVVLSVHVEKEVGYRLLAFCEFLWRFGGSAKLGGYRDKCRRYRLGGQVCYDDDLGRSCLIVQASWSQLSLMRMA